MERAQLGRPMVHMTKFVQIRLKDLGARRVDDRQTDTQTDRQTNAGNNKGNPSDRANTVRGFSAAAQQRVVARQRNSNAHIPNKYCTCWQSFIEIGSLVCAVCSILLPAVFEIEPIKYRAYC